MEHRHLQRNIYIYMYTCNIINPFIREQETLFLYCIKQLYSVHTDFPDLSKMSVSHFSPSSFA